VLEETVFRGFLLPSLTKWLSPPAAVAASSLLFALAHFAPRDFPQLFALGCVLGFAHLRSRSLLTPIAVHGAWNTGTLLILTALSTQTDDLPKALGLSN
jgi:membrane protease YdiL (CAAX protease family)